MYRDDFVLRHIRLLVQVIARVLGLIKEGDLGFALETMRVAFMDYLGMSLDDFMAYPDERLKDFLYFGELDVIGLNKAGFAASMLVQAGHIFSEKGEPARARKHYEKAIRLLLEVILSEEEDPELPDFAPALDEILDEVPYHLLGDETLIQLAFYFDRVGALDRAHEAMQALLALRPEDPDVRDTARSFYGYLQDEEEAALNSGGLTRSIVDSSIQALDEKGKGKDERT